MKVIFPVKGIGEKVALEFDFTSRLGPSETVVGATVLATVYTGVDPVPANILFGFPIVGTTSATQSILAGVAGTIYSLVCSAVTSDGQILQLQGFLAVQMDPV